MFSTMSRIWPKRRRQKKPEPPLLPEEEDDKKNGNENGDPGLEYKEEGSPWCVLLSRGSPPLLRDERCIGGWGIFDLYYTSKVIYKLKGGTTPPLARKCKDDSRIYEHSTRGFIIYKFDQWYYD